MTLGDVMIFSYYSIIVWCFTLALHLFSKKPYLIFHLQITYPKLYAFIDMWKLYT
jgi:hypothetical protein